jgi:hypothetical protein
MIEVSDNYHLDGTNFPGLEIPEQAKSSNVTFITVLRSNRTYFSSVKQPSL